MTASVITSLLFVAAGAAGPDLAGIDRTIGAEPEYRSKGARYCLLVFGPEAQTRVWLALDGDRLYVDRNGDGDLTGADERVEAKWSDPEQREFEFSAGDIRAGSLLHKDLHLSLFRIDHLVDRDEEVKAALAADPSLRACALGIDVELPGFEGGGLEGRVAQRAGFRDCGGLLQFSEDPRTAPVVYFGRRWQVTLYGTQTLRLGRETDLILGVGTPGHGPGTTAWISYDSMIPESAHPHLEILYRPLDESAGPVRKRYELKQRC